MHQGPRLAYDSYPFSYQVLTRDDYSFYEVHCSLTANQVLMLRKAVSDASKALDPDEVDPLSFGRLIEVMTQLCAERIDATLPGARAKEMAELAAYEAIGLSRILALAKDEKVTEFFVDSESSPVYLDHRQGGRCETGIFLTARERHALETHLDTFRGYTLDYLTPSMKNDIEISGARLRISLDLEPISVTRFALDVRRLDVSSLSIEQLVGLRVISREAAAFLVAWLEAGGNCTIVGETSTGKTTLLNALDEQLEPKLRRVYIEDAVETRDMLARGYHQMKVKVDPFERGSGSGRTKESEIVKALHRSPDLVILSEIQSEEHSRAFFHALAAGARGIQTFHASSLEQAIRRWVNMHKVSEQSLLDLGVMVLMVRPDRLRPERYVQRVCEVVGQGGTHRLREIFLRDRDFDLRRVAGLDWLRPPDGVDPARFVKKLAEASRRLGIKVDAL
jgi:type IV secretory pathway ATPase VirB11/archaellum biosynthesis ATPase